MIARPPTVPDRRRFKLPVISTATNVARVAFAPPDDGYPPEARAAARPGQAQDADRRRRKRWLPHARRQKDLMRPRTRITLFFD